MDCTYRFGDKWSPGSGGEKHLTLQVYQMMQPPLQDSLEFDLTNAALAKVNEKQTTKGELLRFKGILIALRRVKSRSRWACWDAVPQHKYIPAFNFGKMRMSHHCFEVLWKYFTWSRQPEERPPEMTDRKYRWMIM